MLAPEPIEESDDVIARTIGEYFTHWFSIVQNSDSEDPGHDYALLYHPKGVGGWGYNLMAFGTLEEIAEELRKFERTNSLIHFGYLHEVAEQIVSRQRFASNTFPSRCESRRFPR